MPVDRNRACLPRRYVLGLGVLSLCGAASAPSSEKQGVPPARSKSERPPFELGGIQVIDPEDPRTADLPPPVIKILKPTKDEKLRVGRPLRVLIGLSIPEGGKQPTFVVVGVKRDGTYHGMSNANPRKESLGVVYTLEAELGDLKGPADDYEIEVEAVYVYMKKGLDGDLEDAKTTRFHERVKRHFDRGETN